MGGVDDGGSAGSAVAAKQPGGAVTVAGGLFCVGVVVFSGSLWALALSGMRWLGAITPLGGLSMLAGWVALAIAA